MTHEYTLLLGGDVRPGGGAPNASAIAWAHDTVLMIGTDDSVRAISRGDSHMVDIRGLAVVPLGESLEVGGPADLKVLDADSGTVAVVRGGHVVEGAFPADLRA
ncbi:MAG: hypothetical protein QFC55_04400 [Chloroflexota bacterium]|nr:hypothetical protein [Chloroflexota bacterium]